MSNLNYLLIFKKSTSNVLPSYKHITKCEDETPFLMTCFPRKSSKMAYSIFEDFITKNGPFIILSKNLKFCLEDNYLFVYTLEAHFAQGVLTEKYL